MSPSPVAETPVLGVGLGYREPLRSDVFRRRDEIDFLEITADHFLDAPRAQDELLALLAEHFTLIPHGLNLSLGGAEGLNEPYLEKLAALVERVDPPWWSEHIAFTRAGGVEIGHLTPLPFSAEALDVLCRNIERARAAISAPLILENITYTFDWGVAEMAEADFLAELCRRTGCGLLLDVTNLHLNAARHGYDARAFLERIPVDQVVQLHFVGPERKAGEWIDSHARAVTPEVWDLLAEVLRRCPAKGAILERDKDFPPFDELVEELRRAREIGREAGRWS